jgi:hypothetical protein
MSGREDTGKEYAVKNFHVKSEAALFRTLLIAENRFVPRTYYCSGRTNMHPAITDKPNRAISLVKGWTRDGD